MIGHLGAEFLLPHATPDRHIAALAWGRLLGE